MMKRTISGVVVLLGLWLTALPIQAQEPVETLNGEVTLNFSDTDLVAVINSVSQITGKNFIIDPRVKGKVTVVSSKPLNADEVYNVFLSILQVQGFATVPTENAIKIIPDATAKQSAAPYTSSRRSPDHSRTPHRHDRRQPLRSCHTIRLRRAPNPRCSHGTRRRCTGLASRRRSTEP